MNEEEQQEEKKKREKKGNAESAQTRDEKRNRKRKETRFLLRDGILPERRGGGRRWVHGLAAVSVLLRLFLPLLRSSHACMHAGTLINNSSHSVILSVCLSV